MKIPQICTLGEIWPDLILDCMDLNLEPDSNTIMGLYAEYVVKITLEWIYSFDEVFPLYLREQIRSIPHQLFKVRWEEFLASTPTPTASLKLHTLCKMHRHLIHLPPLNNSTTDYRSEYCWSSFTCEQHSEIVITRPLEITTFLSRLDALYQAMWEQLGNVRNGFFDDPYAKIFINDLYFDKQRYNFDRKSAKAAFKLAVKNRETENIPKDPLYKLSSYFSQ